MQTDLKSVLFELGEDTSNCFVCGQANKSGLQIAFARDGEQGSRAHYTARTEHDGWPGVLHGGVTFALMDEALGWALFFQGLRGVTARVEAQFKRPIRAGTAVVIRGWTTGRRRRLISAHAEIRTEGDSSELMAEMEATMFLFAEGTPGECGERE